MIFQDVGGRGLLLQRLREVVSALTQFVEQPRILDGDDGLRGEVRDKLDLLVGEQTHFLAGQEECTNHFALVQQWERPASVRMPPSATAGDGHWIMLSCIDLLCR